MNTHRRLNSKRRRRFRDRKFVLYREFRYFGMKLARSGLIHSKVGNMSARIGHRIFISKTGSMLEDLAYSDIVAVDDLGPSRNDVRASSDLPMHRAIYHETKNKAVIHVHSPYAVAESLLTTDECIISDDVEMKVVLSRIPLMDTPGESGLTIQEYGAELGEYRALIIRGHGTYAVGSSLDQAYFIAHCVEHACKIHYLCRIRS